MSIRNLFSIEGHLTAAPVLRFTPKSQIPTTSYIVAVNDVFFDSNNETRKVVSYIPVTTYGKQAESDCATLVKGSGVIVHGRIRSWYVKESNKGGFNFDADSVAYLPKLQRGTNNDAPPTPGGEHDEWLRNYDGAKG